MTRSPALEREVRYDDDRRRSMARRMERGGVRPKGLSGLLVWLLAEWASEVPTALQRATGVWRDQDERDRDGAVVHRSVGGSLLGSLPDHESFRRYIYKGASERDQDGNFTKPMQAALAAMAGRRPDSDSGWMALYLAAIASSGGDWRGVAYRVGFPPQAAEVYTTAALNRLWDLWRPAPLPLEESAA